MNGWKEVMVNGSNAADSDYKKLAQNCEEDNQFYLTLLGFSPPLFPFPSSILYQIIMVSMSSPLPNGSF